MQHRRPPSGPIRVVVAESQPQVRFALSVLLSRRPDMCIVGEAADSAELLRLLSRASPDLLLLSWGSPGLAERDLPARVLEAEPGVCMIVLSEKQSLESAALGAGARAFVYKGNPPEELVAALDLCAEEHTR